jgi:hypothetical protein
MNGRIGDFEKIGMFLVWEIGADELKRPHRVPQLVAAAIWQR